MKAAIIGSGKLAFHLGPALMLDARLNFQYVINRSKESGTDLANKLNCIYNSNLPILQNADIDIVFVWVNDDSIKLIIEKLENYLEKETIIVHSSGILSSSELGHYFQNLGCMWPLQTFSKDDFLLNLRNIPFLISSQSERCLIQLNNLAIKLSDSVHRISEKQKAVLHLSAVIANNFSNHLFYLANQLLENSNMDLALLSEILNQTVQKALLIGPENAQSGPAIRKD